MNVKILLALVLLACLLADSALANALKNHPSPYLALHGDDPVQWRSWGPEAVEQARREHKLLFISSSYLDAYLIDFVQNTQGRAGWPLNVFLTPEGLPVVGALYMPPPDFLAFLNKLSGLWATRLFVTRIRHKYEMLYLSI